VRYVSVVLAFVLLAGCGKKPVSFKEQILPIFSARCTQCHGAEVARGKINIASYAALMNARAVSGKEPLIIPGSPYQSRLYILCETNQPHFRMPPDTSSVTPLPAADLDLLRHWITEGAKEN
jgi:hypothetical protein